LYEGSIEDGRMKYRFISIAQDLVMAARGKLVERSWKRGDGSAATIDDISAFAIPIIAYKEEYAAWIESRRSLLEKPEDGHAPDAVTNGNGLVETVLSSGPSIVSGVQDVPMEDVDVVAVAEEAVEQDDEEDDGAQK
jgi:hypothetical protein